jgi:hypothetical protein
MDEYQEFLGKLQKRGSKPHKVNHCLGSRDAFMWVRRHRWEATGGKSIDKLLYSQIISEIHRELVEMLLEGHDVEFPYRMGNLILTRTPAKVFYEDGELKTNYRTDWMKTLPLWFKDEEMRNSHKRVKRVAKRIYFIRYIKTKARFANKRFYLFRCNRSVVKKLGKMIDKRKVLAEPVEYVG